MSDLKRLEELTTELTNAADIYYNSGMEIMSNKEYDAKFDELKALEKQFGITDGFTSKVGFEASGRLKKVAHEYEAKSLDKTKDIDELVGVHSDPAHANVCLSWKLDGSTVQLTYEGGRLFSAVTRGDGTVGQDITNNSRYIDGIPQTIDYKGKLVVRGEALMTYAEFDGLNTNGQFANPRNLANATITALDKEILENRKVEFRAFELVDIIDEVENKGEFAFLNSSHRLSEFSQRLDYLHSLGFGVVEHQRVNIKDLKSVVAEWSETSRINSIGVPVDGLVVCNEDCDFTKSLKGTEHHPNTMKGMAFKWKDEEVETTLRAIEWQVGRTGVLTPVAVFDTVDLAGTRVSKASLHNYSYIEGKDLRVGDKITVYKANMIIPQIGENLDKDKDRPLCDSIPKECPCCKGKTKLNILGDVKTITCESEICPAKELGRLSHFVSKHGMNIDGLAENTLNVLMNNGLIAYSSDIYTLKDHKNQLLELEGFGEKGVENLLSAIENSKTTEFSRFMYASGIDGFGRGQIKALKNYLDHNNDELFEKYYPESDGSYDLLGLLVNMNEQGFDFTEIEGIGNVLAKNLSNWCYNNLYMQDGCITNTMALLEHLKFEDKKPEKEQSKDTFAGKSFCITGSLNTFANRDECVAFIEANGGKFVSGVSKKTDFLVNNDTTSTSGKNKKAKELGIPIITEAELVDGSFISKAEVKKDLAFIKE